jgi:xanthine/CO dehydrogenase XdhC/CoxF family maturation factor
MANRERFPHAVGVHAVAAEESLAVLGHPPDAAVIMTHRFPEDVRLLRLLMGSATRYIGVLGPRHRTDRLMIAAEIAQTPQTMSRLHAPIGLDLGAETPEEIALAILAEATAALHGYAGGKLRDKGGRIHEPARWGGNPASEIPRKTPKSEVRNPTQIPNPNSQIPKKIGHEAVRRDTKKRQIQ